MHVSVIFLGSVARCNECNIDMSQTCNAVTAAALSVPTTQTPPTSSEGQGQICKTNPVLIYSGLQLQYTGTHDMLQLE